MYSRIGVFAAIALAVFAVPATAATISFDASNAVSDPERKITLQDHSMIVNGDSFTFQEDAGFDWNTDTGVASLFGTALLDGSGFDVDVSLNQIDWGDVPVGGTDPIEPKREINLDGTDIDPLEDWTAFEFVSGTLTVVGDLILNSRQTMDGPMESFSFSDGDVLTLFGRPVSGQFGFQIGEGANGKNLNFGLAGWFGFTDAAGTTYCEGKFNVCDFNLDLEESVPPVPLPLSGLLLPFGLGLLWSVKRRKAA